MLPVIKWIYGALHQTIDEALIASLERAIPRELVQEVINKVDEWSSEEFKRVAQDAIRRQPILLAFIASAIASLPEDLRDQAFLSAIVMIRIFDKHYGPNQAQIEQSNIDHFINRNSRFILDMMKGNLKRNSGDVVQPVILQFVADTVLESLTDDVSKAEGLELLLTFKTAVDVLDHACSANNKPGQYAFAAR